MHRSHARLLLMPALALLAACGRGSDAAEATEEATEPSTVQAPTTEPASVAEASYEIDPELPLVRVWKSPSCGCCADWVEHMKSAGFPVEVHETANLAEKKREHEIGPEHQSCHTATVGGYFVEGHVPADLVKRMLAEEPDIRGLTVPGMPAGSPGMEVPGRKDPYDVLALGTDGSVVVYASR